MHNMFLLLFLLLLVPTALNAVVQSHLYFSQFSHKLNCGSVDTSMYTTIAIYCMHVVYAVCMHLSVQLLIVHTSRQQA